MDIVERVYNYILTHQMLDSRDVVLVAVSGGADSVTLLHILNVLKERLNISLHVAHLDHMFRNEESQEDANFVKMLCAKWNIPCTVEAQNVSLYREHHRLSNQVAAREVRYQFLNEVAQSCKAKRIALGHHADDQAETVLLNLLRGTGTTGIAGIAPVRDNKYIRPLLGIRRYEIDQYCKEYDLKYRTDSSNKKTVYLRNKLRLSLIPTLENEYNNEIVNAIGRLAELSREEDNFIDLQAKKIFESIVYYPQRNVLEVSAEEFNNLHIAIKRRLVRMIWAQLTGGSQDLAYQHVQSVLLQCQKTTLSKIELPAGVLCTIAYGKISFAFFKKEVVAPLFCTPLTIPGQTHIEELGLTIEAKIYDCKKNRINPKEFTGYDAVFDFEQTGSELYVRNRRPGDKFRPQGAGGSVKLKKFLIDQKVPQAKRRAIPLICSKSEIIWVSGLRIGEYWKVTGETEVALHLSIKNIVS